MEDNAPSRPLIRKLMDAVVVLWLNRQHIIGGLVLLAAGLAMIAFLFGVALLPVKDIFTVISLFIVVEGYSIVATLLLTLGLRRLLGPDNRFDRYLDRSWQRVFAFTLASSLIVALCWLVAVL